MKHVHNEKAALLGGLLIGSAAISSATDFVCAGRAGRAGGSLLRVDPSTPLAALAPLRMTVGGAALARVDGVGVCACARLCLCPCVSAAQRHIIKERAQRATDFVGAGAMRDTMASKTIILE